MEDKKKKIRIQTAVLSLACLVMAIFSFIAPVWPGGDVASQLGALTIWVGLIEIYHGFRRSKRWSRRNAIYSGAFSLLVGIILVNARLLQPEAVRVIIAAIFLLEAFRYFRNHVRQIPVAHKKITFDLLAGIGNSILVLGIFIFSDKGILWLLALIMALRHVGIGLGLLTAPIGELDQVSEDIVSDLGLDKYPQLPALAQTIEDEELLRAPYDRNWVTIFIGLLFFIHLGRMGLDRSAIGILSPLLATLGDMVIALIISYAIIWPLRMGFKKISGWIDYHLWGWVLLEKKKTRIAHWLKGAVRRLLKGRMRAAIQFRKAGYSFRTALRTGLRLGLPWAALLAAIMPVLGMSWYFDTENWASGVWDRWAALRTDAWRMAMIEASGEKVNDPSAFRFPLAAEADSTGFSFVVLGDPGEGDASQLVLKDQIIKVTNRPDVQFLVISSDVVYPSGALKDYEKKFWMPMKGVEKPVLAIPGNHDWYDALDGFAATFFQPEAARKALHARVEADLEISSTTDDKINEMISKTEEWRKEYNVPTGFQKAPFFQVATEDFVFITLETGIARQIDTLQMQWLETVLEASAGKFVMVLLGHPFYAIGEYQGSMNPRFEGLHQLLKKYKVPLVMAGDTHDFE
ncbi:MAG: metallophosphoesterase, partial [Chitinophagaceae bacterium]|nr:metallophosphoesterase [Chitinophagaceae bacterium]